MSIPKFFDLFF